MLLTVHDRIDTDGRLVTTLTADGYTETLTRTPQETLALLRIIATGLGYGLVLPQDAIPYDSMTLTPAQIAAVLGDPRTSFTGTALRWHPHPTTGEEVLRPGVLNGAGQEEKPIPRCPACGEDFTRCRGI